MSADGSVSITWADGEYRFRLAIGQLRELQESVNKWRVKVGLPAIGPMSLARLFESGDAWPDDVREVIRLGLIGGGSTPMDALALVKRYVDDQPLVGPTLIARLVLLAALVGAQDDPVGKGEPEKIPNEVTTASSSPDSTEQALH